MTGKVVLGNMILFGGIYLLIMGIEMLDSFLLRGGYGGMREYPESIAWQSEQFVSGLAEQPETNALVFVAGTFGGMIWYLIARPLETRRLKKRFGLLTKPCTLPTPDVKSPHS